VNNCELLTPLISVIMPAYNCEKFVEAAVNSVLKQTYNNYELIIIDDCSHDDTTRIIDKLSKEDSRLRFYLNEKNQGVSATRNRAISLAKGEWVAFLDSDDCWESTKLEKQIQYVNTINASFLFTGVSYIDEDGKSYKGIFEVPEKVSYSQLLKQNVISCSSVLIKKKYIEKYKMEKDDTHEDYGAWLRILKVVPFAYGVNEPLLIYRRLRNSKSGNKVNSLKMAYKTYRYVGLTPIVAGYYLCWYIIRILKKYWIIKK
jgi:teichuronic acid biosynthesis glycosyltransferase TuaG